MNYQYTVFDTSEGYTWSTNTPAEYRSLKDFLNLCERNHSVFIFFNNHVLKISHTVNPRVTVRVSECYDVSDFIDENTSDYRHISNADIENGRMIIRNFLMGIADVFQNVSLDTESSDIMGSLEYFAGHLPNRVISDVVIDIRPEQEYSARTGFFFRSAASQFMDNDISMEWIPELPRFSADDNQLYTALWYAKDRCHFLSILTFIIRVHSSALRNRAYDKPMEYFNYLKVLADIDFMKEVNQKFYCDTGLSDMISPAFAKYIIALCAISDEEMLHSIPLLQFYHVRDTDILEIIREHNLERDTCIQEAPLDSTDIFLAFIKACEGHTSEKYLLSFASHHQLYSIIEYCIEKEIPVSEIEKHISPKDKISKDVIVFLQWYNGSQEKPIKDEKNLIPVISVLYGSRFIDRAVCLKFYGTKKCLRQAERTIDSLCMPLEYREVSRQKLIFLIKKTLSRHIHLKESKSTE